MTSSSSHGKANELVFQNDMIQQLLANG